LLPTPSNKVDFGSSSATTQSLVGNYALRGSPVSTNSVPRTLSIIRSDQCDTQVSLPSDVSQPTEISPAAACNGKVIAPGYNVISTNGVMVEPVKQKVYKEHNHGISPLEAHTDQTNEGDANKTSTGTLDKPFSNEIPTSESDKDRDIWEHLDFSNIGLDDWFKIDFSTLKYKSHSLKCQEI